MLSGDIVKICPNTTEVEFSCTAENVTELTWKSFMMNGKEDLVFQFHLRTPPLNTPNDGYTTYLDNSTMIDQFLFAPITSRLRVANFKVSDLIGGMIECHVFDINAEQMFESLRINLLGK